MNSVELRDRKALIKHELDAIIGCAEMEIRELKPYEQEIYDARIAEIEDINNQLRALGESVDVSTDEEVDVHTLINRINERKKNKTHNNIMEKRFSLLEAVRNVSLNQPQDQVNSKIFADAAMQMRNSNLSFNGQIQIPLETRDLTIKTEHDDVVVTDMFDLILPLEKKTRLAEAGATFYTGLVGDIQVPSVSSIECNWVDEIGQATTSTPTFESLTLKPKRLSCVVPVSKQFLMQTSFSAEQKLRELIVRAFASKLESTLLGDGAETSNTPAGIFHGASPVSIANFADLVNLEAELEDVDSKKYLLSGKAKAALRNMAKSTKSTELVMQGNYIDGTEAITSTHITDKKFLLGNFADLAVGIWGTGLDILVDPYSRSSEGVIRLVASIYVDGKLLRPDSIKAGAIA